MRWGSTLLGAAGATAAVVGGQSLMEHQLDAQRVDAPLHGEPAEHSVGHGVRATIPMGGDGHFWANAHINGAFVLTLVDTGSTLVALNRADAAAIGLDPDALAYTHPVETASGQVSAARVSLALIGVGDVVQRHVEAIVVPDGLEHSLLGMSFLNRLSRLEATRDGLVLAQ